MRGVKESGEEIAGEVSGFFTVWWSRKVDAGAGNRRKCLGEKGLWSMSICVSAHGPAGASGQVFFDSPGGDKPVVRCGSGRRGPSRPLGVAVQIRARVRKD
jgi:hypothetical protein